MTRRAWIALVEQAGGDVFHEAAMSDQRHLDRQLYGIGGFPFPGDEEDVARDGGWVRFGSGWHYDYVAAGS